MQHRTAGVRQQLADETSVLSACTPTHPLSRPARPGFAFLLALLALNIAIPFWYIQPQLGQ